MNYFTNANASFAQDHTHLLPPPSTLQQQESQQVQSVHYDEEHEELVGTTFNVVDNRSIYSNVISSSMIAAVAANTTLEKLVEKTSRKRCARRKEAAR